MTATVSATCARTGLVLSGGRCGTCNARARQERCADCGEVRAVSTRTATGAALCGTCAKRRTAHRLMSELHHTATTTLKAWLPSLDEHTVAGAVCRAAPTFRQAAWLVDALDDVGVLHASTTAPPVIDRLIVELVTEGAAGIAAPRCVGCGRHEWLTQRIDGHRACVELRPPDPCRDLWPLRPTTSRDDPRPARGAGVCGLLQQGPDPLGTVRPLHDADATGPPARRWHGVVPVLQPHNRGLPRLRTPTTV